MTRVAIALGCAGALAFSAVAPASAACTWSLFPTIDPHPSGNQLVGVSGTGASDLWEVGASFHQPLSKGYAIHWNGSSWNVYHESNPGRFGGQLSGVDEVAPNDVWFAGQRYTGTGYANPQALIEHFDGSTFRASAAPLPAGSISALYGFASPAANDVWAAGVEVVGSTLEQPLFEHWNGSAWSAVPGASVPNYPTVIDSIAANSSSDIWAAGGYVITSSGAFQTVAEHWDGSTWTVVPTPNVNGNSNIFNAVVALGTNDVWAIGDYYGGRGFQTLTEHWDGSKWSIVSSPNGGSGSLYLFGASGRASNAVWAAGEIVTGPGTVGTFTMEWNGSAWTVVPSANESNEPVTLFNAIAVLPDGSVWADGGDANARKVVHAVTEAYTCQAARPGGITRATHR